MTIMIIEDSKPMRNLIKRTLKQAGFGDHEIVEAGDGEAGLSLIKESKPDLVLCDWQPRHRVHCKPKRVPIVKARRWICRAFSDTVKVRTDSEYEEEDVEG